MSVIVWMPATDLIPPHGLDMASSHDADKVERLELAFRVHGGFDKRFPALVGYPCDGKVQLLSGTHRHAAAVRVGVLLPVVLFLRSTIEEKWGDLGAWRHVIEDIPVSVLETWTREDVDRRAVGR